MEPKGPDAISSHKSRRLNRTISSVLSLSSGSQQSVVHNKIYRPGVQTSHHVGEAGSLSSNTFPPSRTAARRSISSLSFESKFPSEGVRKGTQFPTLDESSTRPSEKEHYIDGFPPSVHRTSKGVDGLSIPLDQSSRRTTIFVGRESISLPPREQSGVLPRSTAVAATSPFDNVDMHRPVNKDDYLLARGANPRTGVITPGSHSANSSVDYYDGSEAHNPPVQSRWRQKGDQWISLDLGQPAPSSNPPVQAFPGPRQRLRTPQRLSDQARNPLLSTTQIPPGTGGGRQDSQGCAQPPQPTNSTLHRRVFSYEEGVHPEMLHDGSSQGKLHTPLKGDSLLRRQPVESPPNKYGLGRPREDRDRPMEISERTVENPALGLEARSSSAPNPPKLQNPHVDKDLPTIPGGFETPAPRDPSENFLDPDPKKGPKISPSPRSFNMSGQPLTEKELPCLPMSNGQSPLRPLRPMEGTPTVPIIPREHKHGIKPDPLPELHVGHFETQRIGDQPPPPIQGSRPPGGTSADRSRNGSMGERGMPVPVYDNPPKHLSPSTKVTPPRAAGPRALPANTMRPQGDREEEFSRSSNITSIATNMSMDRPGLPRQLRIGPRPMMVDPRRMVNPGRHGYPQRPPPPGTSDIFMNTSMIMDPNTMMSIPMPRTRPRAVARPQMPMRSDGFMYGLPRVAPAHQRTQTLGMDHSRPMWDAIPREPMGSMSQDEGRLSLVPSPLKPRNNSQPQAAAQVNTTKQHTTPPTQDDIQHKQSQETASGLGLMRKCSRCHHGFVDVKSNNTDSVTLTSVPLRDSGEAKEESKLAHPSGRSLPRVPEDDVECDKGVNKSRSLVDSPSSVYSEDERDHSICCPDCCKDEDCHEGCLGHPSPSTTPSPTKSIWSGGQSPSSTSSASELDEWERSSSTPTSKVKSTRLGFIKSAWKKSKIGTSNLRAADVHPAELSAFPRTPEAPAESERDMEHIGLGLGLNTSEPSKSKSPERFAHRRQRSSSSPLIGACTVTPRDPSGGHGQRMASGSRLRVPTPRGLAIGCSTFIKGRTASGTSTTTLELVIPGLGSLGGGAVGEMILVPFEATKMWIRNHPQVMKTGWEVLERGWQMGQIMTTTGWRLWAVVFVYSKTGRLKLNVAKGETAGGFVIDCARSALYFLVFAAVTALVLRILRIVLGVVGVVGVLLRGVLWVVRQVLGLGMVK